jgi:predicted nucleotidyltransferase
MNAAPGCDMIELPVCRHQESGRRFPMATRPSQAFDANRATIRRIVGTHRASNPRVFGSIVRGEDNEQSDLDLLVDTTGSTSLFDIAAIELELERLMGIPVHVTTSGAIRGTLRERVLAEAQSV